MFIHQINIFRRTTLMTVSIILFIVSTFGLYESLSNHNIQIPETEKQVLGTTVVGLPQHLTIPIIGISAQIKNLSVNSKGEMEVPDNSYDVGWFKLGSRPGERGSAVIAGHVDSETGKAGVFANLNRLNEGDKIYIDDDQGAQMIFIVSGSRVYDPGFAEEIFSANDGKYLNLVTCNGVWEKKFHSYSKRLVVFSEIATQ